MNDVFFANVGRTLLKVYGAGLLTVLIGITAQKDLHGAIAFGIAGLMTLTSAAIAAVVTLVPQLSFQQYFPGLVGQVLDAFVHASLGSFLVATAGWFAEPNYSTWHAVLIGAVIGAINVGARAVQAFFTQGEAPNPQAKIGPAVRVPAWHGATHTVVL
jgi:hypothetical protein